MEPLRPGRAGFVAAQAQAGIDLGQLVEIGLFDMRLRRAVAGFAGKALVLGLGQFFGDFGVAGVARGSAGPIRLAAANFLESGSAIVAVLPKGRRREEMARNEI